MRHLLAALLFAALPACHGGASPGDVGPLDHDPHAALYDCDETAFIDAHPLSGPGFDPAAGKLPPQGAHYLVSTTVLYWRPGKKTDVFVHGGAVMDQLDATPGLVAYTLGTDEGCRAARAITVWEDEASMFGFVVSGAHGDAMTSINDISLTGKGHHWEASADDVAALDYDVARAKLQGVASHPVYE